METNICSHSGNIGDVFAALPAMKGYYAKSGKKISLKLIKDVPAIYYDGAVHPTKNSDGQAVMLNENVIKMMIPLLMEQDCISDVSIWEEGTPTGVELHAIRTTYVGMPNLCINRWYFYVFPDFTINLANKWLQVPDAEKDFAKGKIVVTRSERYLNDRISYEFLKPYEDDIVFAGTMREYNNFCMTFDLNVKKLTINNFLELAQAIKQCKFHMTNQTMAFQISQGLKIPRILETSGMAPNCIPVGENAFDFMAQEGLEYPFHYLNGTLDKYLSEFKNKKAALDEAAKDK